MGEIFKTKIRRIGTSFGVLIPKKILKADKIKVGDEVELALLKKKRLELIEGLVGIAKGAGPFEREKVDRM